MQDGLQLGEGSRSYDHGGDVPSLELYRSRGSVEDIAIGETSIQIKLF